MLKKFLPIGVILALVIIAGTVYFSQKSNPQTYTVNLTEDGFSPEEIAINKGDTIVFTTNRNQPFWPASNLHPTHGIYPEFDPREPIEPDKSWQFTFIQPGEWKYHDHLAPLYRGVIKVGDKKTRAASCKNVQCWQDLIDSTLKEKGLNEAFEVLATLYQNEPQFALSCHDFAHKLGARAYQLFSQKEDFGLSSKSSYCGYGFYHGFMETLLQKTGDMNEARRFCEYADTQLKKTTSDAGGACYHGIGHGAVDGSDPGTWGNPEDMIEPALKLCEMVASDENPPPRYGKLFRCVSGVFNALEILSTSNKYKLSLNTDDPFWICKAQPARYKEACFTQFVVAVMSVTGNDFIQSAKIIDAIKEDEYALPTLQSLVVELPHQGKTDYQETLTYCRSLSVRFRETCVYAFAEGFMKYGPPQNEYVKALEFCESSLLTDDEKQACFTRILSILRIWYSAEKSQEICEGVDQKYRWNNCQYR